MCSGRGGEERESSCGIRLPRYRIELGFAPGGTMPFAFSKVDYIMVTVSNMGRSVAFYKDKLGLPMKFGTPEWTEFQTGTTTLALHGGGQPKEATGDPSKH